MSKKVIKILCVEDVFTDAQLVKRELDLARFEFDFVVVDNQQSYVEALDQYQPDIVLCDHTLPSFNSVEALSILREGGRIIPFILITGSMTDQVALELVKRGADDYILKDRLGRLSLSIRNALEKYEHEAEKNKLLWKIVDFEEKTSRDLANLSDKLILATRAAQVAVWEFYYSNDLIIIDPLISQVLGADVSDFTQSLSQWVKLVHPDDVKILYETMEELYRNPGEFQIEYRMILPHNSIVYVWVKGTVQTDSRGLPYRVVGTTQNITRSKLAEKAVRESEIRYKSIWTHAHDAVILGTPDGQVLAANPAACDMFAKSEKDLQARGIKALLQEGASALVECMRETTASAEIAFIRADGSQFTGEASSNAFEDATGRKRTITVIRDITARKKLEAEIDRQKGRYMELFALAPSAIAYMSGTDLIYELANPVYQKLAGDRALIGRTLREAFPELDNHPIHYVLADIFSKGEAYRSAEAGFTINTHNGQLTDLYIDLALVPHKNDTGEVIGVFFFGNDVTEQVYLREKISERQKNYKHLFEHSPIGKLVIDRHDFRILAANNLAHVMYEYGPQELSSVNFSQLFEAGKFDLFSEKLPGLSEDGSPTKFVVNQITKSGKNIMAELSVADFIYKSSPAFLVAAQDITEQAALQKRITDVMITAQKKITKAQIKGQEKEKELIGKELHDNVNQQLCTVQLLLNVAKTDPSMLTEVVTKCEAVVQSAIADIRSLCKSLVAPSIKDIGLQASLQELLEVYRKTASYTIEANIGGGLDQIDTELQVSLYRIVQELLTNIAKYAKPQHVKLIAAVKEAKLSLIVQDDGVGFDTRKHRSGIGLANIRDRVELFDGKFKVESTPGKGCRSEIIVPVSTKDDNRQAQTNIIVAEDDIFDQEMIRNSIKAVTPSFDVSFVNNGKELLERLSATPDDQLPALIVIDYNMPLLDGFNTLLELKQRARFKNIPKVVYSTSYHRSYEEQCKEAEADAFIKKGVTVEEMQKDVKSMLKHLKYN